MTIRLQAPRLKKKKIVTFPLKLNNDIQWWNMEEKEQKGEGRREREKGRGRGRQEMKEKGERGGKVGGREGRGGEEKRK